MSRADICGRCEHFSRRDDDGAMLPQAAHGIGRCRGYDGHEHSVVVYVRWDAAPTVLFGRARDMGERNQWIDAQKRLET